MDFAKVYKKSFCWSYTAACSVKKGKNHESIRIGDCIFPLREREARMRLAGNSKFTLCDLVGHSVKPPRRGRETTTKKFSFPAECSQCCMRFRCLRPSFLGWMDRQTCLLRPDNNEKRAGDYDAQRLNLENNHMSCPILRPISESSEVGGKRKCLNCDPMHLPVKT